MDKLRIERGEIKNGRGQPVGKLSKAASLPAGKIEDARVSAIVVRTKQQSDPKYLERIQSDRWETVLCEVIVAPANGTTLH